MNDITDTLLSAYIDGELDSAEAQRVKQAIHEFPDVAARYRAMQTVDEAAKTLYAELDEAPVSEDLVALIKNTPLTEKKADNVVPLFKTQSAPSTDQGPRLGYWGLAASVFLCGMLIYGLLPQSPSVPYGHLADQLNRFSSGTIAAYEQGRSEIVQSWRDEAGNVCREIRWHTEQKSTELSACWVNAAWEWQISEGDTGYQTATDDAPLRLRMSREEEQAWIKVHQP